MSEAVNISQSERIADLTRGAVKQAGSMRALAERLSKYTSVTYGSIGHWAGGVNTPDIEKIENITLKAPPDSDEYKFAAAVLAVMKAE